MDPIKILKKYCKENGLRYTPERETILNEIYKIDGHFDIDSLFLKVRKKYPERKIAKASIYRNIPHLIKSGLIRESFNKERQTYYEHTLGHQHHDHMRCLKCGKIFEFYDKVIDKKQQSICKSHRFLLTDHIHILAGYCHKCKSKAKNKNI